MPSVPTLARALDWHLRAMRAKACRPRSVETLTEEVHRHLSDWLERPLDTLTRDEVATRHETLTETSGPYLANRVLHHLRALYNTAVRRSELLPPTNPTIAVTFNRTHRRRAPIPWEQLPDWAARVARLRNPVRGDLQRFLLLTGLRSLDARTVRLEDLNPAATELHRPTPKGGESRAFTLPLSPPVTALVLRRRHDNEVTHGPDCPWLFPTRNRQRALTHVQEAKQQRQVAGRKVQYLPSPHRLRDTFATAAHECGVHPLDLKCLLNHALPAADDVTQGYIRPSLGHLSTATAATAHFLEERMGEGSAGEVNGAR